MEAMMVLVTEVASKLYDTLEREYDERHYAHLPHGISKQEKHRQVMRDLRATVADYLEKVQAGLAAA